MWLLRVDSTGTHHLENLQSAFLGEGDTSIASVFGPLQVGLGGEVTITSGLTRPVTVKVVLVLDPGLELSGMERERDRHFSLLLLSRSTAFSQAPSRSSQ